MSEGIVLYTDGSARRNGAGWGIHGYTYSDEIAPKLLKGSFAIPTVNGYADKKSGADAVTLNNVIEAFGSITEDRTNNHGEILGMLNALRYASEHPEFKTVVIRADSEYVIKSLTQYIYKWMQNGWRKADGDPVAHKEKWEAMHALYNQVKEQSRLLIEHVKAHEGEFGNENADWLARLGSGEVRADLWSERPYTEFLESYGTDAHHPLLLRSRILFNIGSETRPGVYYNYHLGQSAKGNPRSDDNPMEKLRKSEVYLGTWVSDQVFAVVVLDTPEPQIEQAIDIHRSTFNRETIDCGILRVDSLYGKTHNAYFERLGRDSMTKVDADLLLMSAQDAPITRTLNPPQRVYDAVIEFNRMERHLDDYVKGTLGSSCHVTDITDRIIRKVQATPKSKVTYKVTEDMDDGGNIEINLTTPIKAKLKLIIGIDIPSRNVFNKLAGDDLKVDLLLWVEGGRYYYEVVITMDGAKAIYASPQLTYILQTTSLS